MTRPQAFVTNLELRESNPDGTEGAGLSHRAGGMVLLHVLELASYGEPRGCATVLHDAGDHGGRYEELAHALAEDGWAVALPDLRGHGRSEGERGHGTGKLEVLRDVDAVLDHLAYRLPDEPQVLLGQGLGAVYAAVYALERPERVAALVLASPLLVPPFELPERKGGLVGRLKKVGPSSPGRIRRGPEDLAAEPEAQAAWRADELVHDVVTLGAGESARAMADELRRRARELAVPALVLHGTEDPLADAPAVRALAGGSVEVREVAGARHDVFHDRGADEVRAGVRAWLSESVPRTGAA